SRQTVQNVPTSFKDAMLGGYVASKENGKLDVVLLATGSELGLAYDVKSILKLKGYGVRIVSIPNMSLFDK
ncbi:MAG: transketolase, partial [Clostridia bacterium]|nr:transketolase [Clostridia bacterium]